MSHWLKAHFLCVCSLCEMNFTRKIVMQNLINSSTSNPIYSSTRPARNLISMRHGRYCHPLKLMTLLHKLSEASFRSYEVLNIPNIAKGVVTEFKCPTESQFQPR